MLLCPPSCHLHPHPSTSLPNRHSLNGSISSLLIPFAAHCDLDSALAASLLRLSEVTSGFHVAASKGYFKILFSFEPSAAFDAAVSFFLLGTFFCRLPSLRCLVCPHSDHTLQPRRSFCPRPCFTQPLSLPFQPFVCL